MHKAFLNFLDFGYVAAGFVCVRIVFIRVVFGRTDVGFVFSGAGFIIGAVVPSGQQTIELLLSNLHCETSECCLALNKFIAYSQFLAFLQIPL